ncbi:PREDICTED: synaptophysin-like protein 1 [Apaloderma vittatum]|uniref:synaptophysin-like protein 1 n=1 Tax=Apaloderma vittatum TaxID=57397 RepID=UPI000521B618|nr:PREDICTED: synaptophysin-like protein 1 [Apaloderma vittatum]
MAGLRVDFGVLLEPLGFIKVLEWIFSIFAFATCGGFRGETTVLVSCKGVVNKTVTAAFAYPFALNTVVFSAPDPRRCGGTWMDVYLVGNFSCSAQFFVTLAVLVFLYCIAALVVYIGYKHVYQQKSKFPLIDLAVTSITAFLWVVSTFAWTKAVSDIRVSTGASLISGIQSCKLPTTTCRFVSVTGMGTLNVSALSGLLNMVLWGGNIWFVYKDTDLYIRSKRISPGTYLAQTDI